MNGKQINRFAYSDLYISKYFQGTYSIDMLPGNFETRPSYLVVNTLPSSADLAIDGHWFLLCIEKHQYNQVYDSYGLEVWHPKVLKLLGNKYRRINCRLQQLHSSVCGQYVCYFLYKKARNYSMEEIVGEFSRWDPESNDRKVAKFFEEKADFRIR